ncbi:MAG: ribosome assembly cofactor RimP [Bacteroidales bacterium]|nr:ribosome assembly cofactor RimP [Bacteroidales bacterium]
MIDKQIIIDLVDQYLLNTESESYLIEVTVSRDNNIVVELDNDEAVDIDECVELSRYIDQHLDRDVEDYELEVGSAGLTSPLKKLRQFAKFEGETMEVLCRDGKKLKGVLGAADEEGFTLSFTKKVKPEGSKKKIEVTETQRLLHKDVNQVRYNF